MPIRKSTYTQTYTVRRQVIYMAQDDQKPSGTHPHSQGPFSSSAREKALVMRLSGTS